MSAASEETAGFVERPLFRDDTPQDLLGQVYLCSLPLNRVFARPTTFANLGDCEAAITALGATNRPVVIFNAADQRVFWRMTGPHLHQALLRTAPLPKLKSSDFESALEKFHHEFTETPDGLTSPWANANELLTKPQLEREIRNDLYLYLRYLMQDDLAVFRELFTPAGRADLLVRFQEEKQTLCVELKVLRAYKPRRGGRCRVSEKFNVWWGKKGVVQAFCYKRASRGIGTAYACCFDARESNQDIPVLSTLASEKDVKFKRFFMYPSTDRLHEDLMN